MLGTYRSSTIEQSKMAVAHFDRIQSVDRLKILNALDRLAAI